TGRKLTRKRFVKAMERIKKLDTGVGPNITFGPKLRAGAHSAFVVKAAKGRFHKVTGWREPRNRP
ncbi:MAG: hypothetical protein KJ621_10200, partial [Proteobacteria bacterium]|nr:hypothetical protein [Pseudomonadota bacterium]